jgi:hypothetical protein
VYEGLASGCYTIWRGPDTPGGQVTVTGGQVTSHHWPC